MIQAAWSVDTSPLYIGTVALDLARSQCISLLTADWPDNETDAAKGVDRENLWEEQWDDDDAEDDFASQLR